MFCWNHMCFCCCKASLFGGLWLSHSVIFSISNICSKACLFLFFFFFYICFLVSCECRWTASYWPVKMSQDSESVRLQHIEDEERFRKTQIADQKAFQEKLEEMQVLNPWKLTVHRRGSWSSCAQPRGKLSDEILLRWALMSMCC